MVVIRMFAYLLYLFSSRNIGRLNIFKNVWKSLQTVYGIDLLQNKLDGVDVLLSPADHEMSVLEGLFLRADRTSLQQVIRNVTVQCGEVHPV